MVHIFRSSTTKLTARHQVNAGNPIDSRDMLPTVRAFPVQVAVRKAFSHADR